MSTPPVTAFFSKLKKDHFNNKNDFVARKFNERIQKVCDESSVKNTAENTQNVDVDILREQIKLLEKELKQAKTLLRKANDVNMQKDLQITALKQQLNNNKQQLESKVLLFENHAHRFDSTDIKKIRSIKAGQRNDSAFILQITRALYKNEESKMKERRVTSRKYKDSKKLEISADKKEIMREMLEERVIDELEIADGSDAVTERVKMLNNHMRHALKNSVSANERKQKRSETIGAVSTLSTPQIEPVFSNGNDFSSTPIVHQQVPALPNSDCFRPYSTTTQMPYPFSPIYYESPYQHTSQSWQPPNYSSYYGQYQPNNTLL